MVTREDANLIHSREVRDGKGRGCCSGYELSGQGKDIMAVQQEQDHGTQEEG